MTVRVTASGASLGAQLSEFSDRRFKYLVIAPAILIILLIGLFPLIYTLLVSVQNINMTEEDTSFHGVVPYLALFRDTRLWLALLHTLIIAAARAARRALSRHAHGPVVPGAPSRPSNLRGASGAADHDCASCRGRDVAAPVRPPLRPDQSDPRVVRRRAGADPVDDQPPTSYTRRSCWPRSGSGRPSCSSCSWRHS